MQDLTEIPFDFKTLQDLIVGNPVFLDSTIVSYKKTNDRILMSTIGKYLNIYLHLPIIKIFYYCTVNWMM
ncbi:MAG: hypothetical protein WDM71_09265 [Ferruginibacter sp.]